MILGISIEITAHVTNAFEYLGLRYDEMIVRHGSESHIYHLIYWLQSTRPVKSYFRHLV